MFKNFKLTECDNFLYGAYACFAFAVSLTVYLIARELDLGWNFVQGLSWFANGALIVTIWVSGIMWLEESYKSVVRLMDEKIVTPHERYSKLREELKTTYGSLAGWGLFLVLVLCVLMIIGFIVWHGN